MAVLDAYVESSAIAWLSRPDVYQVIQAAYGANDEEAAAARAEVKQLEIQKTQWLAEAKKEKVKPATVAEFEADFDAQIEAAQERANAASFPAVLRDLVGPEAAQHWAAIDSVAVKREALQAICTVKLTRALKRDHVPVEDRVIWGGLIVGKVS